MRNYLILVFILSSALATQIAPTCGIDFALLIGEEWSCNPVWAGSGAHSEAYLLHNDKGKKMIVKVTKIQKIKDLKYARREADLLKLLDHKNIIHLERDFYDPKFKSYYQCLEFAESGSLLSAKETYPSLFQNPLFVLELFVEIVDLELRGGP